MISLPKRQAKQVATSRERRRFSKRVLDLFYLVGAALLVCILGGGAFIVTEVHHISPLWVFLSFISIGFFAGAREEYRKEFRSVRFIFFVCSWLVVNMAVFVVVLGYFGWLYLIPALLLEQVIFYMTAYWLFGLRPPLGRHRGNQT
jgi:4-amino-4-deoxy-L-arabinose transferase-like glycosyltransferase